MFGLFKKSYNDLSPKKANARLGEFRVVDVREPAELRDGPNGLGAIAGAENVPLATLLRDGLTDLAPGEPILLVCRSGGRSGQAAEALSKKVDNPLFNMAGGMLRWKADGLPAVRA